MQYKTTIPSITITLKQAIVAYMLGFETDSVERNEVHKYAQFMADSLQKKNRRVIAEFGNHYHKEFKASDDDLIVITRYNYELAEGKTQKDLCKAMSTLSINILQDALELPEKYNQYKQTQQQSKPEVELGE